MAKTNKINKYKKSILYLNLIILFASLIYSAIFRAELVMDIVVIAAFFSILHYFDKIYYFSAGTLFMMSLAIMMHLFGVLGLYSSFIIDGVLGYDKIVHLTVSFGGAYTLIEASNEKHKGIRYMMAILAVLGAGAIIELIEFFGWYYFGINNGGIFTIGDGLPAIDSDLQRFDTYFDMLFNLAGTLIATILASGKSKPEKKR